VIFFTLYLFLHSVYSPFTMENRHYVKKDTE